MLDITSTMNESYQVSEHGKQRSNTIDLADQSLLVDISDALSEREKVKFTVHTKVKITFKQN